MPERYRFSKQMQETGDTSNTIKKPEPQPRDVLKDQYKTLALQAWSNEHKRYLEFSQIFTRDYKSGQLYSKIQQDVAQRYRIKEYSSIFNNKYISDNSVKAFKEINDTFESCLKIDQALSKIEKVNVPKNTIKALFGGRSRPIRVNEAIDEFKKAVGTILENSANLPDRGFKEGILKLTLKNVESFQGFVSPSVKDYGKREGREGRVEATNKLEAIKNRFKTISEVIDLYKNTAAQDINRVNTEHGNLFMKFDNLFRELLHPCDEKETNDRISDLKSCYRELSTKLIRQDNNEKNPLIQQRDRDQAPQAPLDPQPAKRLDVPRKNGIVIKDPRQRDNKERQDPTPHEPRPTRIDVPQRTRKSGDSRLPRQDNKGQSPEQAHIAQAPLETRPRIRNTRQQPGIIMSELPPQGNIESQFLTQPQDPDQAKITQALSELPLKKVYFPLNEQINRFKETMAKINTEIPNIRSKTLKSAVVNTTLSLIREFKESPEQAVHNYEKRGNERESGQDGDNRMNQLCRKSQDMSKELISIQKYGEDIGRSWKTYMREEKQSLQSSWDTLNQSYRKLLETYQQRSDQSNIRKQYKEAQQAFLETKGEIDLRKIGEKLAEQYKRTDRPTPDGEYFKQYFNRLLDDKYLYTAYKLCESLENEMKIKIADSNKNLIGLKDIGHIFSDYSGELTGTATLEKQKGKVNQDAYYSHKKIGVHAVFDGVGGNSGGHIASAIAVDCLRQLGKELLSNNLTEENLKNNIDIITSEISKTIEKYADGVYDDMATTASILKIMENGTGIIANTADSRVLVRRKDSEELEHLTLDNKASLSLYSDNMEKLFWQRQKFFANIESVDYLNRMSEEDLNNSGFQDIEGGLQEKVKTAKRAFKYRNSVQESLSRSDSRCSIYTVKFKSGDTVVLSTDGVHDNLMDKQIVDCLKNNRDLNKAADAIAQNSKEEAKKAVKAKEEAKKAKKEYSGIAKGPDDITVIAAEIRLNE